ncbi:MAG: hypothetical protein QM813_06880 [Verrucomicrobiota bacterium]
MRFLSVADRELRAAARRSATYYVRWITGIAFFGLLVWLLWVFDAFTNQRRVPDVLQVFAVLIFLYCLIIGTARTADCLSSEKREGTLGLLFLTNLNSVEIVAGKLCSNALATVYGLVAIFPILALPLLMGGVTGDYFWRTVLALLNAILFSLAAGFAASAVCVRQFPAVAVATGLALLLGLGTLGVAGIVDSYRGAKWVVEWLAISCPFYPLLIANGSKMFGANHYWLSLLTVAGLSLATMVLVAGKLAWSWRDQPKVSRSWKFWRRAKRNEPPLSRRPENPTFRRRLLNINPFLWLAGRKRISSPVFMGLALILVVITAYVTTPFFVRVSGGGSARTMEGSLLAWLWTGLAFHALSLYYAAMVASQRLAEDKQVGALEMILCTPTTERIIARGLWLAYARRMLFPALLCLLVHLFFLWQVLLLGVLEPPGRLPRNTTAGELFWAAVTNQPIRGVYPEWSFCFIVQILLVLLGLLVVAWLTCGWVGRWLGLKMKHPGFAPMLTLALIFVPPILEFTFLCYLADKIKLHRMPERQFLPLMMWVAVGVGVLHCALLSWWAAGRLRREFRNVVTSRFQPSSSRRWWLPGWRGVLRLMMRVAAVVMILVLLGFGFYGYQNWRSRRAWQAFQTELKQRGESLDFMPLLPEPVPREGNFAQTAAFQKLVTSRNNGLGKLLLDRNDLDNSFQRYVSQRDTFEWTGQYPLPLIQHVTWLGAEGKIYPGQTNNAVVAPVLLRRMQRLEAQLEELSFAAKLPHFQVSPDRSVMAVIRTDAAESKLLERVQFLFVLRANARLVLGTNAAAAGDVLTSLQLTRLARQLPDAKSSVRVHVMLVRACQPLWEGCVAHDWTEAQLAAFQQQLAGFDLFSDYTNAVRRVVLANFASWRAVADNPAAPLSVPNASGGFTSDSAWRWQPRGWWYDRCLQLYHAGQRSLQRVDGSAERVRIDYDWEALNGLPLDDAAEQVIEPYPYMNNVPNPTVLMYAKTALNQAMLACALERYWLAQGSYPKALSALQPTYLDRIPRDVMTGRDMIYQRLCPNHYVLRSVGPDGDDDRKSSNSDDWLWAWPTNSVPRVVAPGK